MKHQAVIVELDAGRAGLVYLELILRENGEEIMKNRAVITKVVFFLK